MKHQLRWYKSRIGKSIYRKPIKFCNRGACKDCLKTEINIFDEVHAQYLYNCQFDLDIDYYNKPL